VIRLVFVCSGNICRSPMAAGLARQQADRRGVDAAIISCGTLGIHGRPAAQHAIAAAAELDVDISDHYSQGVAAGLVRMADFAFVMAPRHERALVALDSKLSDRIVRTWEFADESLTQIDEPVGGDLDAFRVCRDRLDVALGNWFDQHVGNDEP